MHHLVRALPLALGFLLAALAVLRAQPVDRPAIFAPMVEQPSVASRPVRYTNPAVSSRSRVLLQTPSQYALADLKPFEAPVLPANRASLPEPAKDRAVVMDPYVVTSPQIRIVERRLPDPPVLDFLKTGAFYRNPTG